MFQGFVALESTFRITVLLRNGDVPANGDSVAPTVRVYGPSGIMTNGTGSASFKDTGSVTAASNASPIVITSAAHGLSTGTRVTITGVSGNSAANGTFTITYVSANTFSLDGSTGNGAYVSGGVWNATGLYSYSVSATAANGYATGITYVALATGTVSSSVRSFLATFVVV